MLINTLLNREQNRRAIRLTLKDFEELNAKESGLCLLCGDIVPNVPQRSRSYPCPKCITNATIGLDVALQNNILSVKEIEKMTIEIKDLHNNEPFCNNRLSVPSVLNFVIAILATWGCVWLAFALAY